MPSILNEDDKNTVKRFVPKQSNKIQAVAVARLYVAYPDPTKWTYTGLQGAIILCNDLVGNTYWLKMVDISVRWLPPFPSPPTSLLTGIVSAHSLLAVESFGIRRSLIHGCTTKTAPFSIHSSSKNAWPP
jgi:hypothetical protein